MIQPLPDGQILDFVPARPAGPRLLPDHDESVWGPGDAGVLPEPVLGAAVPMPYDAEPVSLGIVERLQPRSTFTLSWWVMADWKPTVARRAEQSWDPDPKPTPEPSVGAPLIGISMVRERARRTRVTVRIGVDALAGTVDLDTPFPFEMPREGDTEDWHHLAVTFGGRDRRLTLFLDGAVVASGPTSSPHLDFATRPRIVIDGDAGPRKILWLGPVRLHGRVRSAAELVAERQHDRATYPTLDQRNPLAFRLADDRDDPAIYITDDDVAGRTLHLVVENRSRFPVALPRAPRGGKVDGFLEFRFRPGCLVGGAHHWVEPHAPAWRVESSEWTAGATSLFVGRVSPLTLDPGQSAAVTLHHVRADGTLGAHGTHVELLYRHPHHPHLTSTRVNAAEVRGQRGRRTSPLRFATLRQQIVVNDGRANSLKLSIINTSHTRPVSFTPPVGGNGSRLTLSIDTGAPGQDWALATSDQLLGATFEVEGAGPWRAEVAVLGERPQWVFTPTREHDLAPGGEMRIVIGNLRTRMGSGASRADLRLENISGYWDDDLRAEIQKSHLVEGQDGAAVVEGDLRFAGSLSDRYGELLPGGVIVMWHGSAADVPAGWVLCDGGNGAPDLSDRFIRSTARPAEAQADRRGGLDAVTLSTDQLPPHTHGVAARPLAHVDDALINAFANRHTRGGRADLPGRPEVTARHSFTVPITLGTFGGAPFTQQIPISITDDLTDDVANLAAWVVQTAARASSASVTHLTDDGSGTARTQVHSTGGGQPVENRPAYYDLCFIMKRLAEQDT